MSEKLRLTKPRSALAVFLMAGVAIAGCGGNTKSADKIPVGRCGSHDYSKPGGSLSPNISKTLATAKADVLTLQQRALRAGGSIDLPRYDGTTEIQASPDDLELSFRRTSISYVGDHIHFPIHNGNPKVAEGAIACFNASGDLVSNGTFETLEEYVDQTAGLNK